MAKQGRADRAAWAGEMFRLLAETALDYAVFIVAPDRHVLSWGKGAEHVLGFTAAEIVGRTYDHFFTPEDVAAGVPQAELDRALATGRGDDDRWHVRKDGTRFWAAGVVAPLRDAAGTLLGFGKIVRDRTDLGRAADAGYEWARRRNRLIDHAPVMIVHCDADRRYTFVNKPYAARFGLHPREVVGRTIREVLGAETYAVIEPHVAAVLAGERVEYEAELVYAGLGPQWMRCAYDPEFDAAGRVRGFIAALVNVTEARRAGDALRETEGRLRTLSDNLPRGAIYQAVIDPGGQGRFTYFSAGIEGLIGVTPDEIAADPTALYGLIHDDDRGRVAAGEAAALRDLTPFDCEFRQWTRGGELRWVHCRSAPRRLPAGGAVWDGIVLDATDRRAAADALRQSEAALREADRRKDEFLATLAHELRNPLAPIRNALEVIALSGGDAAAVGRARGLMERQLQVMVRLVDDLLDVSRISRGKIDLQRERVTLAAVVEAAVEAARSQIEQAGHELTITLPPAPVVLDADPTRLAQVVSNLLTNSAKYTHRGGHIRVSAELGSRNAESNTEPGPSGPGSDSALRTPHSAFVTVSVTDDGIGIPPGMLDRVFEMFTQVDRALEKTTGGLGIGLSLVKGLVEMHGGTIAAHSAGEGKGSTFTVRLPVVAAGEPAAAPPAAAAPAGRPARRRVLVVDDNIDGADSLGELLRLTGYEVRTAYDGEAGVAEAARFRPDVVLLDLGMPKLNGYEACRRIRGQAGGAGAVVVAVTGWGQDADREKTRAAGFDHHLVKPVAPAAVLALLAALPPPG